MKSTHRFGLVILLLAGLSLSCALSPDVTLGRATPPPGIDTSILFQDDFSDDQSGWATLDENNQLIAYQNGGLRILVNETQVDYWSNPGLIFNDVHVEVDATKLGGPDDNDFGIMCRYIDEQNFYGFLISSDGYYGISKMKAGDHNILGADEMEFSDVIRTGNASNHLTVDCLGNTLRLAVNGETLIEAQDEEFTKGDIGLVAGTFATGGTDILFDNFVVSSP